VSGSTLAIETERLGRNYGSTPALEELTLEVAPGSVVGLLGPNGAGKTTAMLLLATLLAPTRGTARIFGHNVTQDRRAVRRRLGLVFQETSVDGLLSVRENLLFAARLAGLSSSAARVAINEALERHGLSPYATKPAAELSGGWRRLLDITRATLHQPDLLILDEPTVGLDPEHRNRVWSLLEAQRQSRGTTVLFSTHYLAEAESSEQVVLLSRGRAVANGAPASLRATIGGEVAEIAGAGAAHLEAVLQGVGAVQTSVRMESGFRIGLRGPRERVIELAGLAPGIDRFTLRPATLEDVYFSLTDTMAADEAA
jgi:ABC-type multidrug transport system ATPase subunit